MEKISAYGAQTLASAGQEGEPTRVAGTSPLQPVEPRHLKPCANSSAGRKPGAGASLFVKDSRRYDYDDWREGPSY